MLNNLLLHDVFKSSKQSIIIFKVKDGKITYVNKAACELYNYTAKEIMTLNFSNIDPIFNLRFTGFFQGDINGSKVSTLHYGKSTSINVSALYIIAPFEDDDICLSIAFKEDVEKSIPTFNSLDSIKLEAAVKHSPFSIIVTDLLGRIEYVNPKFTDMTGYSIEETLGKNPSILKSGHQSREFYEELWKTISNGEIWEGELLNKSKSGELYWEYAKISPIFDTNNNIIGFIAIKEDLKQIKFLEKTIIEKNKDLVNLIQNLQNDQSHLIQKEKLKSLAAGIAHEINNPISYIKNNVIMLREFADNVMPQIEAFNKDADEKIIIKDYDFMKEELDSIFNESIEGLNRVSSIVKALRGFTSVDTHSENQLFNIKESIDNAITLVNIHFASLSIKVNTSYEFSELFFGIPEDFSQVFYNILINCFQAIESKDNFVIKPNKLIEVRTSTENNHLVVSFKDNGSGIKDTEKSHIFDAFYTTKPVGTGTGLGLNTVYDTVVNKYKGKIEIDSEYGYYTEFKIFIPIVK